MLIFLPDQGIELFASIMGEIGPNPMGPSGVERVVRSLFFLGVCLFPALGACQVTVGPETMNAAMEQLRAGGGLALLLRGEDQAAHRLFTFKVNTYYLPATTNTPPKVEIWSYRNDKLDRLLVGDGENFVRYDPALNQYSLSPYKDLEGLMKLLQTTGGGMISTPTRLLRDIHSTQPWVPWLRAPRIDRSVPFVFSLSEGEPVRTRTTFRFAEPFVPENPLLKDISGVEYRAGLTTAWTMQIFSGLLPVEVRFKFVAPANARPVSAPSSVRTGN